MTAIGIGLICAAVASIPEVLQGRVSFQEPLILFAIGLGAALVQRLYFARYPLRSRAYDGVADLLIHIHSRYVQEAPERWYWRALISLLLFLTGGHAGIEGAAAEASQGFALQTRNRSEKWSEQRRRSDVASLIAAAVTAAFQAPFAAVVLCLELGIGGRTLSAVTSAITAYIGVIFVSRKLGFESAWVPYFKAAPQGEIVWWALPLFGIVIGLVSVALIRFFRYFQESIVDLFKQQIWLRPIAGGVLLVLIYKLYPYSSEAPAVEFMSLMTTPRDWSQTLVYWISEVLILATVLAAFGTVGIFGPLFTLGGVGGLTVSSGVSGLLTGGAGAWGGILGAPLAGAILVFELTQSWRLMAASLITGVCANFVRKTLKQQPMIHRNLQARGLQLLDGRSADILRSIPVRDAMVTDHEWVYEHELVKDLTEKFLNSKHPFLPVVDRSDNYVGLLTLDLIQEGLENADASKANFFEVKDLLYKSKAKLKTVYETDSLAVTAGLFGENACVAVINKDARVMGLLFAYSVRAAYDREVARRALAQSRPKT